jgi:hypothetical protein
LKASPKAYFKGFRAPWANCPLTLRPSYLQNAVQIKTCFGQVWYEPVNAERAWKPVIFDSNGKKVKLTHRGDKLMIEPILRWSGPELWLMPGDSVSNNFDILPLYRIHEIGKYKISVSQILLDVQNRKYCKVISDFIDIQIVP